MQSAHLFTSIVRRLPPIVLLAGCIAPPLHAQSPSAPAADDRNIYTVGPQVRPTAAVPGDLVAAGGRVVVDQPVGADAMLAGGMVDVRAPIGDDLRAAGGDVTIESSVGGELFASGGNVAIRPGASVAGAAVLYGATITVHGRIDGDLTAEGQRVLLDGEVRGNVRLTGRELALGPQARIAGALNYASSSELKRAEGAAVAGAITREARPASGRRAEDPPPRPQYALAVSGVAGALASFLAMLACGAVFLLLVPAFAAQAAARLRATPGLALAVGFGMFVALPVLAVLLFITLLGIPLGIATMALYPVMLLAGFVLGVLFIAGLLPRALKKPAPVGFAASMGWFALALALVGLVALVPLAGAVVIGLLTLAGIGALVLELHARRGRRPPPSLTGPQAA